MSLAIKGINGALRDHVTPFRSGLTLGRQGDIPINDVKASALHAQIVESPEGGWILEDNDSKNGTRVGNDRVRTAALVPGVIFYIGDQGFEVVEFIKEVVPPPAPEGKRGRYWHEVLSGFLEENAKKVKDRRKPVAPLDPAVVLDFVRGVQVNSRWILGYGPRKIGPASLDLPIWEPGAPAVCFEIAPSGDGIVFKTAHPNMVRLNRQEVDSQVLRVGDTIEILETLIEVDFTE